MNGTRPPVASPPGRGASRRSGLTIKVSRGAGTGRTPLSAFDAALRAAGTADFNLVRLSSVIPPGSRVVDLGAGQRAPGNHGDLLYCVYSAGYATRPGESAWAGITWGLRSDDSGAGVFVEHSATSGDDLEWLLAASLEDVCAGREGSYRRAGTIAASVTCISDPCCAVAIAAYTSAGWRE